MNTLLWIAQAVSAVLFGASGVLTAAVPKRKLASALPWVEDFSAPVVRFIGAVKILGAAGLVLPALTGIAPVLTPLAGVGLALMMVLAAVVHLRRGEPGTIVLNAILFALVAFVAWGRFGEYAL